MTRTPTAERPGNLVLVPRPPAGNGMWCRDAGTRRDFSAPLRLCVRPLLLPSIGEANVGQRNVGRRNGDKGITTGGGHPAPVLFIPLSYIPLSLRRAPGRRRSKSDLSRLAAFTSGTANEVSRAPRRATPVTPSGATHVTRLKRAAFDRQPSPPYNTEKRMGGKLR